MAGRSATRARLGVPPGLSVKQFRAGGAVAPEKKPAPRRADTRARLGVPAGMSLRQFRAAAAPEKGAEASDDSTTKPTRETA